MIWILPILIVGFFLTRPRKMKAEEEAECDFIARVHQIAKDNYKNGTMPKEEYEQIRRNLCQTLEGIKEKYD